MFVTCPICCAECTVDEAATGPITCPQCGQAISARTDTPGRGSTADGSIKTDETRDWNLAQELQSRQRDRYEIESLISEGGFARVYLATDLELGRRVAVKIPRREKFRSPEQLQRFLDEARLAAKLRHPGIVTIYDVGQRLDGTYFIAMEHVSGPSLTQLISQSRIPVKQAVSLLAKAALAVHEAHRQGLIHRDLKPSNILLDEHGEPRVVDFGLAVHESAQVGLKGEVAGTPQYMSPEQFKGEVHRLDGRTDIWSLGVILYQLLTGRRPFQGDVNQLYDEVLYKSPKPPRQIDDQIPMELEAICFRCLGKGMTDRYSTAKDLADALQTWTDCNSISSQEEPSPTRDTNGNSRVMRRMLSRAAVASLVIASASVAAIQLLPVRRESLEGTKQTKREGPSFGSEDRSGTVPVEPPPEKLFRIDPRAPRGKWIPLLGRKPLELVWRDDSAVARWVYDRRREEALIDSIDIGFFAVGETESTSFALKTGIVKKSWTGHSGLFWGYQARSREGHEVFVCQTVSLSFLPENGATKCRIERKLYQVIPVPGDVPNISTSTICPAVDVDQPDVTENELEVDLSSGLVSQVRWCGKPLPRLNDNADTLPHVTPTMSGRFGVWSGNGTTVFLNTQIKLTKGPVQQEQDSP